ncbi:hypothetical protein TREMEDRAFT_34837 [Tremella mesenterica DSM 1558]|uniref:uncharacterized protein n=1 Tax=Tremella mesenterica (strain ATCC 24925 / CBS 8224 / DSM 1558 / NBRC 9311 / NRRL Y-6157 / RJB 2259-6 / UBC 559-6) TaxID=578456 RepID=UPI00032C8848|nr:uncharacterized protein TREMEDRAFT_34837 [Tremella mesenterica DSM 1558]EIW66565.1 hypothetical protein TREMEDRAFT_34837 [Tremella mesenterica DSM 1558]
MSNGNSTSPTKHTNGHSIHEAESLTSSGIPRSVLAAIRPLEPPSDLMYDDDRDWSESQRPPEVPFIFSDDEDGSAGDDESEKAKGKRAVRSVASLGKRMPIKRDEIVRLILQALRDMGYDQSSDVLESESGFRLSDRAAADFQAAVLGGRWAEALALFEDLGIPVVTFPTESEPTSSSSSSLSGKTKAVAGGGNSPAEQARFLISQQKYLEYLESGNQKRALAVLRSELAPVVKDSEVLHTLSGYMMCMDKDDLYERSNWDGAEKTSRRRLLEQLQVFISPEIMVPSRRLAALLEQARRYQQLSCVYHDEAGPSSLYTDHECVSGEFPCVTTHILADHTDEVWRVEWSPDGSMLASSGKEQTVIIWQLKITKAEDGSVKYGIEHLHHLTDHRECIDVLAWSPDGKTLVTAGEKNLYLWNTRTGKQKPTVTGVSPHTDSISAVRWMPDGSGFVASSMDCKIIFYSPAGAVMRSWAVPSQQVLDFVITPDSARLIAVSSTLRRVPIDSKLKPAMSARAGQGPDIDAPEVTQGFDYGQMERGLMIIRISDKEILDWYKDLRTDATCVTLSSDGKRILISCSPDEIQMWTIEPQLRYIRKFSGHIQGKFLIRSCFGAPKDQYVLSGSEADGSVYVWQSESPTPIEVLAGHGETVNCVAWNPIASRKIFASCSDDWSIRIWQPPSALERTSDAIVQDGQGENKEDDAQPEELIEELGDTGAERSDEAMLG